MIQLDNKQKGLNVETIPLTPQDEALNVQLCKLPVITDLQAKDDEIISDLEGLKEGQTNLENKVDEGFKKGRIRMDGIEGKVETLSDKFDSFMSMFAIHVKRTEDMHREVTDKIVDNRYSDLQEEKRELKKEIEEGKKRRFDIVKIILTGVVSLLVGGLVVYFTK